MIKEWWKTPEQAAERSPLPVCQPTNDGRRRRRQDSRLCRCSRSAAAWNRDDPLQLIPGVFDRLTGDISYSRRARVVFQTDMSNINRMLYSHYCKVCLYEYVYWHSKLDTNFFGTTSASFVAACFLSFSINLKENKKLNFKVVDVLLFFLAKIQNCFYVL